MNLHDHVETLAAEMRAHDMTLLEIAVGGERLILRLEAPSTADRGVLPPSAATDRRDAAPVNAPVFAVTSPEMGLFTASALPDDRRVTAGMIVGFVGVGVLRVPVTAGARGVLGPALFSNGAVVGYGVRLFVIDDE